MKTSVLATTFGAAALALTLAACDQQQAENTGDGVTAPIQQQGAVPADPATTGQSATEPVPNAIPAQPGTADSAPQDGVPVQSEDTQ